MTSNPFTFALMAASLASPPPASNRVATFANDVLQSTTVEWQNAFSASGLAYRPPRLVIIDLPRRHPGSGSGYARGVLILDGRELDDVLTVFKAEGTTLAALMIAHEVGHHVQLQIGDGRLALTGKAREIQADCLAGWWLSRANARAFRQSGHNQFDLPDIDLTLPRLLGALNMLGGHVGMRGMPAQSFGHGTAQERADAIIRGLRSLRPTECGLFAGR